MKAYDLFVIGTGISGTTIAMKAAKEKLCFLPIKNEFAYFYRKTSLLKKSGNSSISSEIIRKVGQKN
ncbi:MAG: hypothetical protein WD555_00815 [Fulvivirga sp.]